MVQFIVRRDPECYLQYEGICTGKSETADHILAYDDGGKETPKDLAGACKACNWHRGKRELTQEQLERLAARGLGPLARHRAREQEEQEVDRHPVEEPLRIIFDGAGKPSHRKLLESMGVGAMMLSYWDISRVRKIPAKGYLIESYFPDEVEVYVESGWAKASAKLSVEEQADYAEEYTRFLEANAGRFSGATEPHLMDLGAGWMKRWREEQGRAMGVAVWPVWTPRDGMPALMSLSQEYDNVALSQTALEDDPVVPPRLGALHRQHQTRFHALGCANPDTLKGVALATASTQSWASPQMRGETIVWDGRRLVRYRADRKDQARLRYKAVAEKAGLDYQALLDDDPKEATRLAIWSYQQLEINMQSSRPTISSPSSGEGVTSHAEGHLAPNGQGDQEVVGGTPEEGLNSVLPAGQEVAPSEGSRAMAPRPPEERVTLPVFGVEMETGTEFRDGEQVTVDRPLIRSQRGSMRQCNTCVISGNCPAFEPDSSCKFDLPIEVRSKEQLQSLLYALLEMQGQRVAFAQFAEQMNGGYPDPNLSQEMDRFMRMTKSIKDLENNHEFIKVSVESQASSGVLSRLFGDKAHAAQELPQVVQADEILQGELMPGPDK